jgi:hypothetical protein
VAHTPHECVPAAELERAVVLFGRILAAADRARNGRQPAAAPVFVLHCSMT